MEPSVDTFLPSRRYANLGWAAFAGSLVGVLCAFKAPYAFVPAFLCILTAAGLFWLASRPPIYIGETQFNIGERAIAWREVREINHSLLLVPLILRIKLTNSRYKLLVYPGELARVELLLAQLKKGSHLATFDGVPYREYWRRISLDGPHPDLPPVQPPVRLLSSDDEAEIERLYQTLKTVGRLDDSKSSGED
jgi:hypothetical protein